MHMPDAAVITKHDFSWVDLATKDPAAAKQFYSAIFGWTPTEPQAEYGGYAMFQLDGRSVGGVVGVQDPSQPSAWTPYIAVDDVAAVAGKVAEAGGEVAMEPMEITDAGKMALIRDTTGAYVGLWQAGQHVGWDVRDVPGAVTWLELSSSDPAKVKAFYSEVFGWEPKPWEGDVGFEYTMFALDGRGIGGLMQLQMAPMSHWLTYFAVEDTDSVVSISKQQGATILVEPSDITGVGRFAVIMDPTGAVFAVLKAAA